MPELKNFASDHNIKFKPRMNKQDLVEHIYKQVVLREKRERRIAALRKNYTKEQLEAMTVPKLKSYALDLGLKLPNKILKAEIIQQIEARIAKLTPQSNAAAPAKKEQAQASPTKKVETQKETTPTPTANDKKPAESTIDIHTKEVSMAKDVTDSKKTTEQATEKDAPKNIAGDKVPTDPKVALQNFVNKFTKKDAEPKHPQEITDISDVDKQEALKKQQKEYSAADKITYPQTEQQNTSQHFEDSNDAKLTKKKKKARRKKKSKFGLYLWRFTYVMFTIIFIATIAVTHFAYQYFVDVQNELPPLAIHKIQKRMQENTGVYDVADNFVANLAEESFVAITYDEIPEVLIDAITSAEDGRFLRHKGIDGPRTIQAVVRNLIADDVTGGGSTITQQVIKVTSLKDKIINEGNDYKHSNERKIHEWILAYQLEQEMSKEDILTAYFNTLGYGQYTGVGTAAKRYFNKSVSQLTTPEAILLAGIPQASTSNNPYIDMETAKDRYDVVAGLMHRHGHLSAVELKAVENIPLADLLLTDQQNFTSKNYNYFSAVENELINLFNIPEGEESYYLPYYTGLKIYTEMDTNQQALANEIMDTNNYVDYLEMLAYLGIYEDDINLQAAFTVVNPRTGGIPAIGAARRFSEHQNNYAVYGYRSPGSAIKPIIDYAPGMELLGWNEFTPFQDKETFYSGTPTKVSNFGGGPPSNKSVPLQSAVSQSLNTTAVQAIQQVGVPYAGTFAANLGISSARRYLDAGELYESAALGGGIETTTTELAGAYAAFANGGQYNKPHFIRRIENSRGEILYEYKQENTQVMSGDTAAKMTNVLKFTRNTGTPASYDRSQVDYAINFGAKTGTSSYGEDQIARNGMSYYAEKDHWIVGYSPEYAIAVWTGFNIENDEVLQKTGGNKNSSKSYGSHIMTAWMNTYAPRYTDFDHYREPNTLATMAALPISHDEDAYKISWQRPAVSFPTAMWHETRVELGGVVYDVFATYDGEDEQLLVGGIDGDTTNFDYTDYIKGDKDFTIRILARFEHHNPELAQTSSQTVSIIREDPTKDETPKDETTKNN